jgi:lipid-binding SYLF domain-containing protein
VKQILISMMALTLLVATGAALADREVEDYSATINMFKENPTVAGFFGSAYGYAVFPTIGKGGLGIGASHGDGQVYRDGAVTGFTSYSDVSIGLQAGGQAYSQVVFFENQAAYDNFTSGNFEFDAGASAVAITASAEAGTSTTGTSAGAGTGGAGEQVSAGYHKGMLVFTVAKGGLMYEASIGGQKYKFEAIE